jgi:signal transduction histidine kinase
VTVRSDPERMLLPAAVELAAYRIGVEATANALRHSAATEVTIDLTSAASVMQIRVHDNAPETGEWTAGVGLRSMRDRAELLGGRFTALPGTDGGTVEVMIPIHDIVRQDA